MGVNGIYGLSGSGLDVESMVKAGMLTRQSQYDKMQQKYTKNQWEKEAFATVYQDLTTFNYKTLSDYKLQNTTNAHKATSNNSSITATASASAASMAHKVEVNAMATNAYIVSTKSLTRRDSIYDPDSHDWNNNSMKLADVLFKSQTFKQQFPDGVNATYSVENNRGNSVSGVSGSDIAFSITISDGVTERVTDSATGTTTKDFVLSYTYDDLYNGKTFNDLVSDINGLGTNVRATYDSVNDKFSFYNKEGGSANTLSIKSTTNLSTDATVYASDATTSVSDNLAGRTTTDFFNNLGVVQSKDGELYGRVSYQYTDDNGDTKTKTDSNVKLNVDSDGNLSIADSSAYSSYSNVKALAQDGWGLSASGTDASVKVDGITYDKLTSNKLSVNGVTYEWTDKVSNGTSATVTVSQDTDKIVENVKKFVEDYNKMLSSLYEKYDEQKADGKYEPLTESQKEGMKDEQIEKWEEKAKQGLLYHDSTIRSIIDEMRDAISTKVEGAGKYNTAYSIGISTTGLKGQLTLDEDKLKKALADDENAAYNVISKLEYKNDAKTAADKKTEAASNYAGSGLAQRLGDIMLNSISKVKDYAGTDGANYDDDSDLGTLMRSLKEKMDNFKTMMEKFEDALYKKYDAMEVALAQLGTQLSFITG